MEKFLKAFSGKFGELSRYDDALKVLDCFLDYFLNDYCEAGKQKDLAPVLRTFPENVATDTFAQLREIVLECRSEYPYRDLLGQFYTFNCASKSMGQFFTPAEVADMQAKLTIGGDPKPGQTVLDPACGSGGLLMAAARIYPYFLFFAADVSAICCKMTLVNFLINEMVGEVCHMNSLTNEFFQVYVIGARKDKYGEDQLYFIQSFNSHHSVIHRRSGTRSAVA